MNAPEMERQDRRADKAALPGCSEKAGRGTTIVEELCLAALGRPPGEKERRAARKLFAAAPPEQAAQDFLWALLNSYEFLFVR